MKTVDALAWFAGSQDRRQNLSSVDEDTWHELEGAWHRVVGWSRDDGGGLLEVTACGWILPVRDEPETPPAEPRPDGPAEAEVCERCRR